MCSMGACRSSSIQYNHPISDTTITNQKWYIESIKMSFDGDGQGRIIGTIFFHVDSNRLLLGPTSGMFQIRFPFVFIIWAIISKLEICRFH
jgi:hypothetical protein